LRALPLARISSSSLSCIAFESRFCVFWMRNTMSDGMMEQMTTPDSAAMKAQGDPVPSDTRWAKRRNDCFMAIGFSA
jgi:hypothetical protein